jgi:hypothetical protein
VPAGTEEPLPEEGAGGGSLGEGGSAVDLHEGAGGEHDAAADGEAASDEGPDAPRNHPIAAGEKPLGVPVGPSEPLVPEDDPLDFALELTPASARPGDAVTIASDCWELDFAYQAPGDAGDGRLDFSRTLPAIGDGGYGGTFTLPAAAAPGEYRVVSWCQSDDAVLGYAETEFTVLGDPPGEAPKPIADFAVAPAQGAPGDSLRFSGQCVFNGTPGDAVALLWSHAGNDVVARRVALGEQPLASDGTGSGALAIPADALPVREDEHFGNGVVFQCLSSGWRTAAFGVGVLIVGSAEGPVKRPTTATPGVERLADTGNETWGGWLPGVGVLLAGGSAATAVGARRREA